MFRCSFDLAAAAEVSVDALSREFNISGMSKDLIFSLVSLKGCRTLSRCMLWWDGGLTLVEICMGVRCFWRLSIVLGSNIKIKTLKCASYSKHRMIEAIIAVIECCGVPAN